MMFGSALLIPVYLMMAYTDVPLVLPMSMMGIAFRWSPRSCGLYRLRRRGAPPRVRLRADGRRFSSSASWRSISWWDCRTTTGQPARRTPPATTRHVAVLNHRIVGDVFAILLRRVEPDRADTGWRRSQLAASGSLLTAERTGGALQICGAPRSRGCIARVDNGTASVSWTGEDRSLMEGQNRRELSQPVSGTSVWIPVGSSRLTADQSSQQTAAKQEGSMTRRFLAARVGERGRRVLPWLSARPTRRRRQGRSRAL